MREYSNKEHISFDDILLVPQYTETNSRKDISLHTMLGGLSMGIPFLAAPMDTVCEAEMAAAIRRHGGYGVIHRYMSIYDQVQQIKKVKELGGSAIGSVGARGSFLSEATSLGEAGAVGILVDTANGHNLNAIEAVKGIRTIYGDDMHIMAGNVSTWDGFARLADAGADSIRVGIGGGSACTTRLVTGHGVPTLSSILEIRERVGYSEGPALIADGGIRNSGHAAKALAAGANAVMLGRLLAGTDESPGEIAGAPGHVKPFKVFRGMASEEAQADGKGKVSGVEGVSTTVPYIGSVDPVLDQLVAGVKSALSYTGVENLLDFYTESLYNRVTSTTLNESKPHAKE